MRSLLALLLLVSLIAARGADYRTGPEGAFVEVRGHRLWYWTEGTGEPLILVEGGPGAYGYLDPFFKGLTDRFTVIHFRGLGRDKSDRPTAPGSYSFDSDVADLEGFRQAIGLGSFNLLGHSYGGMVVTAYALQHAEQVKRLIVANGVLSGEGWQAGNENVLASVRDQYPEIWARLTELRARGLRAQAPECQQAFAGVSELLLYVVNPANVGRTPVSFNPDVLYGIAGPDADFQVGGSVAEVDLVPRLRELKMPVLFTASRFDRVVIPRFTLQYAAAAPQAQFVLFEHSGHNVFLEEHDKFIATLRAFLTR